VSARAVFVGGVLLAPVAAGAQETSLRADERLVLEWHGDNRNANDTDDHYGVALQRLNLTGASGNLRTSAQIDGELFLDRPSGRYDDDGRLERVTAEYDVPSTVGDFTLTAGDFHRQLGRGIVLSLRRLDELGQDVTLRGGQLAWARDDVELDLFAGRTNAVEFDAVSQFTVEDPEDTLAGGAAAFHGLGPFQLGLFGVHMRPKRSVIRDYGQDHMSALGASVEAPALFDHLALYLEGDWQGRHVAGDGTMAKAFYATADLTFGAFALQLEGLWMDDFFVKGSPNSAIGTAFDYAQPPTLERIDQEVIDNTNTRGGRARLSYGFADGAFVPYVNGMVRQNNPDAPTPLDQVHLYGGFEWGYDEGRARLNLSGGWRRESQDDRRIKGMLHGEGDWLSPIGGGHAVHLSVTHESRTLEENDYARGSTIAGLEKGGLGAVSVEVGYDTQDARDEVRRLFVAGIVSYEVDHALTFRATAGSQRGGLKCVAGVCRDFPEFSGARVEMVARGNVL
jgi:hypothetical protein